MNQKVKIAFVGDIFPGERDFTLNYGIKTQFEKHKGRQWIDRINSLLGDNDIIIGNLESPLICLNEAIKKTFYGNPDFAFFLKECGINVLNVANNHIMEQGNYGFESTLKALNKATLDVIGNIVDSSSSILLLNVKNVKIGIAGFSNVDLHKIHNDNYFAILNEDNVLKSLSQMNQLAVDIKILCFHWGNEYIQFPSMEQRTLAYKFIDSGADIIVGHHPHVIQPYEKHGNGHIIYSLGNFMFDLIQSKKVGIGLIAAININENKAIDVELKGVKLSYGQLVVPLTKLEFSKYYSKISNRYEQLKNLSVTQYICKYTSILKKNHFYERILMRTALFNEFLKINSKDKVILISNIKRFFIAKICSVSK